MSCSSCKSHQTNKLHSLVDDEPATVALMDNFAEENGYANDLSDTRLHHEIYLSDPRKSQPEKWKTVIRHPIKMIEEQ